MSKAAPPINLSAAYSSLETAICEARNVTLLMELAAEGTILTASQTVAEETRKHSGPWLDSYRVFVLTEDQHEAMSYESVTRESWCAR